MARLPLVIPLADLDFEGAAKSMSGLEGFFCIDARAAHPSAGRNSIVSAQPASTFSIAGAFVTVDDHVTIDSPCSALRRFAARGMKMASDPYLPFSGGVAGYIGFEGARAFRGLAPASGFSRHAQCRLGIYRAALLFDRTEGTARLVATGENTSEAERAADALMCALQDGGAAPRDLPPYRPRQTDVRVAPAEGALRRIVSTARQWLRSESVRRIHVVRHSQRPSSDGQAMREFLAHPQAHALRAVFTHEGSLYIVTSWDALLRASGRRLRSTLAFMPCTDEEMRVRQSTEEEVALRLAQFLDKGGLRRSASKPASPSEPGRVTFEGTLPNGRSPIDALVDLLPAHCLTGAPHERALEFIDRNEEIHRSLYGGAFGYFDASGLSFSTVQRVSIAADGTIGTTVGLDLTEDLDEDRVISRFDEIVRTAPPRTD